MMIRFAKKIYGWMTSGVRKKFARDLASLHQYRVSGNQRRARLIANKIQRRFGVFISPRAVVPPSVDFRHPTGIVIGDGVRIAPDCVIYQNVTLGGARMCTGEDAYPRVGRGTVIFAGAVLIGDIDIGKNCVIGANSVVTSSIPSNSTAVGAPARVIRKDLSGKTS